MMLPALIPACLQYTAAQISWPYKFVCAVIVQIKALQRTDVECQAKGPEASSLVCYLKLNSSCQRTFLQSSHRCFSFPPMEADDRRAFALERTSLLQQLEIDRILGAFRLNPYDVLEVPLEADDKEINKIFRKKSLLIHPDKVKHGKGRLPAAPWLHQSSAH